MPSGWAMILVCLLPYPADAPRAAWVDRDHVELLDEPNDAAFSTGRLRRGQKVTVRRDGPTGWATLDPPPGSFSYIDERDIEVVGLTEAIVANPYASVRTGRDGAALPGPSRTTLRKGTSVRLLDRRPLVLRRPGETRTWLAIVPPRAEVRFVREETLSDVPPVGLGSDRPVRDRLASNEVNLAAPSSRRPEVADVPTPHASIEVDRRFVSLVKPADAGEISPDLASALSRVSRAHEQILSQPMDRWDLSAVREEYEALLRGASGADRRVLEVRLGQANRQQEAAEAARSMEALLAKSRARDQKLASVQKATMDPLKAKPTYDATGLLQTTSKLVDGRRVHALLGDDGNVVAFLIVPPGIAVDKYLSQRVGVRGEGQYNESLLFKLIKVHDLEPLVDQGRGRVLLSY